MDTLLQDIRYGIRVLRKRPAFTLVAVLSLALGIGANTTIFTLVNAVFLDPLPVEEPNRLASVFTTDSGQDTSFGALLPVSFPNYEDFRDDNNVFSGLVCVAFGNVVLTGEDEPLPLQAQLVTSNYFQVLGVEPEVGSLHVPEEGESPQEVAILSHAVWARRFGADPEIVGQKVSLSGMPFIVGGVAPQGFKGTFTINDPDLVWLPLSMRQHILTGPVRRFFDRRRALFTQVFGRLEEGVGHDQAGAELKTIASRLEAEYPDANPGRSVEVTQLATTAPNPNQEEQFAMAGGLLMVVVGLVLLIACANVANLLLGRAADREKEIGIRLALGAGRVRLVRQLLTESLLLALGGGAVGLLIAGWARGLLWNFRPPFLDVARDAVDLSLDTNVLLFTLGVSVVTGVVFGLAPALQFTRPDLKESLKEGGRKSTSGSSRRWVRTSLVVAEVALSLVALVGAGLFVRSMQNAREIDPGFHTEGVVLIPINPASLGYEGVETQQLFRRIEKRAVGAGGVEAAALSANPPLGNTFMRSVVPEGMEAELQNNGILSVQEVVTPSYLETMGIPLLQGRGLTRADDGDSMPVALVNDAAARRFWPDESAVGKRFRWFSGDGQVTVVGVVADTARVLGQPPQPAVYLPMEQEPSPAMVLHARTGGDPQAVIGRLRGALREIEPNLPLDGITTVEENLEQNLWAPRMGASLLGGFGLLALVLAMVGVYGVMSHTVGRRAHEMGIRIAMGAQSRDVLGLVIRQGMTLVGIGIAVGLGIALATTRWVDIQGFLWDVSATDPVIYGAVSLILLLTALAAIYLPARRIVRLDPVEALRAE